MSVNVFIRNEKYLSFCAKEIDENSINFDLIKIFIDIIPTLKDEKINKINVANLSAALKWIPNLIISNSYPKYGENFLSKIEEKETGRVYDNFDLSLGSLLINNIYYYGNKLNNTKTITYNSIKSFKEDDLNNFNEKNIDSQLTFNKIKNSQEYLKTIKQILDYFDDDKKLRLEAVLSINKKIDVILEINKQILKELKNLECLLNNFYEANKIFDIKDYKILKKKNLEEEKRKENVNGFTAYYLFNTNKNGWMSLGKLRKNSKTIAINYEKNIQNATLFGKNVEKVMQEFNLNKNDFAIIYAKIEPISYEISHSQVNNELLSIISSIDKKEINKVISNQPEKITKQKNKI